MNNDHNDSTPAANRRTFLKRTAGLAGGLLLAGMLPQEARSKERYPAVGTFPEGVGKQSVFVGITCPLTGPYSAVGVDLKRGYELALNQLNAGKGLSRHIESLKGKQGVLGKHINWEVADSETKANTAIQLQTRFIRNRHAIMISGSVSSSVAIALQKLAQREKVLYMVGASNSNDTTGKDCQRYGFRPQASAYMDARALAPVVAKKIGRDLKVVYLIPDYTYGHTVFQSLSKLTAEYGWKTVGKFAAPVGTPDFSSYLINVANSGADVFVNVTFGGDSVASMRQAKSFGILDKMKVVVPSISPFQAKSLGADIMQGVYGAVDFWWTMADRNDAARTFVTSFEKAYNQKPRWGANLSYMQMFLWADAVERSGTFYPPEVIKTLEAGTPIETPLGETHYRSCDHQLVRPIPIVVGKSPAEMQGPDDFYDIVELAPGADTLPPCDLFGCSLGPYK